MRAQDFWQTLESRTRMAAARCAELLHLGHTGIPALQRPTHSRSDGNLRSSGPRILLLTSSLGCGHARAAEAVDKALLNYAPTASVRLVDWWSLINAGVAEAVRGMYLQLVQAYPDLYDHIYRLDERTWRSIVSNEQHPPPEVLQVVDLIATMRATSDSLEPNEAHYASDRMLFSLFCRPCVENEREIAWGVRAKLALMAWCWARLVRRLDALLREFEPDAVVSTQMIPAALVSSVKQRRGLDIPSIAVPTDFGVHDFWVQPGTDAYCIAHESLADLPEGLDRTRVHITGIPLMPEFAHPLEPMAARDALGLTGQAPVTLVLGGGLGLGVDAATESLLNSPVDTQVVVLTGRNPVARAKLATLSARPSSKVRVFDWTERMDIHLRAADVVVGKPGGLTVAEALACGRPVLATRSLRGQEGFNVRFLEQHRIGRLVPDADLAAQVNTLLEHPFALSSLQARAWSLGQRTGAAQISEVVHRLIAERGSKTLPKAGHRVARV